MSSISPDGEVCEQCITLTFSAPRSLFGTKAGFFCALFLLLSFFRLLHYTLGNVFSLCFRKELVWLSIKVKNK